MKVKCLDSGSQAHFDSTKVFEYKEGDIVDGLSEATAISMRDAGHCEILMGDEEEDPAPATDDGGSDDAGTKSESSDTPNEKGSNGDAPWKNNGNNE